MHAPLLVPGRCSQVRMQRPGTQRMPHAGHFLMRIHVSRAAGLQRACLQRARTIVSDPAEATTNAIQGLVPYVHVLPYGQLQGLRIPLGEHVLQLASKPAPGHGCRGQQRGSTAQPAHGYRHVRSIGQD